MSLLIKQDVGISWMVMVKLADGANFLTFVEDWWDFHPVMQQFPYLQSEFVGGWGWTAFRPKKVCFVFQSFLLFCKVYGSCETLGHVCNQYFLPIIVQNCCFVLKDLSASVSWYVIFISCSVFTILFNIFIFVELNKFFIQ